MPAEKYQQSIFFLAIVPDKKTQVLRGYEKPGKIDSFGGAIQSYEKCSDITAVVSPAV